MYFASTYYASDISANFAKLSYTNITKDQIYAGLVMINVYYDDLYYTVVQEIPAITADSLLGLIGNLIF